MYIIAGSKKKQHLVSPKGDLTRPTSARLRETVFDICQQDIADARFLDLFAGSGAVGLEALSRGAKSCVFVDNNKAAINAIKHNIQTLGFQPLCQVIFNDVFTFLNHNPRNLQFDLIFVDPPYEKNAHFDQSIEAFSHRVIHLIDLHQWLSPGGTLFIEDVQTAPPPLTNLTLINSRRSGRATLNQFRSIK